MKQLSTNSFRFSFIKLIWISREQRCEIVDKLSKRTLTLHNSTLLWKSIERSYTQYTKQYLHVIHLVETLLVDLTDNALNFIFDNTNI